ncbi:MAG: DNA repair protein RecO [Candidatus Fournierella pullistercoris]|uniref:DNA repair protein RecO n=1 Tax=Candidatus Allofournierella pullistercoris TaxID=2838597 RepID=A0A948T426_9FIRM|nr:DNA repair protein RecO [Candidatus Fournierella pullistercoris]
MQLVTPGLVLREVKLGEADRILTILTPEHGMLTVSAKGSLRLKSKLFSGCGLFCYSEFTLFAGKNMYQVDEAQVKRVFFGLRERMEATALAMYMAELAMALKPMEQEGATLLRLLLNSLYLLSEGKKDLRQIKAVYELRAVCESGFRPNLLCCESCHRYDGPGFYFDPVEGRLLCQECAKSHNRPSNLDLGALTALRHIALVEDKRIFSFSISEQSLAYLGKATQSYALCQLDKPMKTLDFLNTMLS